jgi:hypothetical protein
MSEEGRFTGLIQRSILFFSLCRLEPYPSSIKPGWLLNLSIDIEWIMLKELINGSLDHTYLIVHSNPCKRIFRPAIWPKSPVDSFA